MSGPTLTMRRCAAIPGPARYFTVSGARSCRSEPSKASFRLSHLHSSSSAPFRSFSCSAKAFGKAAQKQSSSSAGSAASGNISNKTLFSPFRSKLYEQFQFFARRQRQQPPRRMKHTYEDNPEMASIREAAVENERWRAAFNYKNQTGLYYVMSLMIGTVALSYGSVPMYKMICQTTGYGGQPIKSPSHYAGGAADEDMTERLKPSTDLPRLRITFQSSVSSILPWKFVPQQREVRVRPGETALAFYTATNNSPDDIIGVATYSVTPAQVAPYFAKIQCFCFEEQRLRAGESVDMPVFFFIDKAIADDRNCRNVENITLSYTFFKAKYDNNGHLRPVPMKK